MHCVKQGTCDGMQESKRKAQEELVGARQAEKATQKRLTALENDIVAAAAQVTLLVPCNNITACIKRMKALEQHARWAEC